MKENSKIDHMFNVPEKLYSGNVSEVQKQIVYNLIRFKRLGIKVNNLKQIDIAGIFMLYLIYQFAKKEQLEVKFLGLENEVFSNGLHLCGLQHVFV